MSRRVSEITDCLKTFEGDGIPVTRAFPVPGLREAEPFLLFDHFGPINYSPGGATGVPAHPHCGYEATAVQDATSSLKGMLDSAKVVFQ